MIAHIMKHMSVSLCIRVAGVGLMFIAHVLIARSLDIEAYGIFSYVVVAIPMVSQLVDVGFRTSAMRYITQYKNKLTLKRGFIIYSLKLSVLLGLVVAVGGFLIGQTTEFTPALNYLLQNVLWLAGCYAILQVVTIILRAENRLVISQSLEQIGTPALLIGAVVLSWWNPSWGDIYGFTVGYVLAIVVPMLLGLVLVLKHMPGSSSDDALPAREWVANSIPMGVSSAAVALMTRLDILILGVMVSPALVAVYAVVHRIGNLCLFPFQAVGIVTAPHIATMCHEQDSKNLKAMLKHATILSMVMSLILLAAIVCFGKYILALFGPEYVDYHTLLICFSVIYMLRLNAWPMNQIPNIANKQTVYMKVIIGVVAIMALLFPVAISMYGLYGALAVSGVGTLLFNVGLVYVLRQVPVLRG